jgi:hypothetical protein
MFENEAAYKNTEFRSKTPITLVDSTIDRKSPLMNQYGAPPVEGAYSIPSN